MKKNFLKSHITIKGTINFSGKPNWIQAYLVVCVLNLVWYFISILLLGAYIGGVGTFTASLQVIPWMALVLYLASILFHLYTFMVALSLCNKLKLEAEDFVEKIA